MLRVVQIPVGPMANFAYLAISERSMEALVVDSGWEVGPIVEAVRREGAKVSYAVATHGHFDHVSSLDELAGRLGAKVMAHAVSPVRSDVKVEGGDVLKLGDESVRILHTPGHTEDSICLYDGGNLFTGDTLFVGTIGRFEREDAAKMYRSLNDVLLKLPPDTMVYSGHDYGAVRCRTLGEEARSNQFLKVKSLEEFLSLFG